MREWQKLSVIAGKELVGALEKSEFKVHRAVFGGEASREEVDRLASLGREKSSDFVIALGGGKTIDTAKTNDKPKVSQPLRSQGVQRSGQTPMALCKYDEHMMSLIPDYKPMSEKELRESMYRRGATDATMDQYLKSYDLVMEDIIQRGGFRVIGMKPQLGDPNVYTVCVPNSPYVLRMWEGGMTYYGHFCLDFYDTDRKAPVNLPAGHGLYSGGPSMPPVGFGSAPNRYLPYPKGVLDGMNSRPKVQAFGSWERNLGMSSIPEGEEKWSFPEGSCLVLKRDGHPDFTFQVPVRRAYFGVQAQTGFAYWR